MRDSFIFHTEYRHYLERLTPEEQLSVYNFLIDFAEADGELELPEVDRGIWFVLKMITDRMLAEFANYEKKRAVHAECGKKGGRPKKPKGFSENQKDIEKPNGFSENQKNQEQPNGSVFVSVSDSVSDIDCVCVNAGAEPHTPDRAEVDAYYSEVCRSRGVSPRDGFVDRFLQCSHKDWQHDVDKWVQEDIARGAHDYPKKTPSTGRFANFQQSNTDWNEVAEQIMQDQEQQLTDRLDFV